MTLEIVQARLDRLLQADTPKVVMLTGEWGSGKTYQWKRALERVSKEGVRPRYAYVSLFGLTSLTEVRKRITEEMISSVRLPNRGDTVGEAIEGGAIGLKPMQILKLLPVIPYLGKLESLAQELSFATVRDAVVCIDDLERAPASLRLADLFGLASFLREERRCRVLLISNRKKLSGDAKDEFTTYLEKVVEESVDFAPTPDEACVVALGTAPSTARKILAERLICLGISNIRVISRLGVLADELAIMVRDLHPGVLVDVINTLALFGVAHFIPDNDFPSAEYLLDYGPNWTRYLTREDDEDKQTEEEKLATKWDRLIEEYGYRETSPLDRAIYAGIVSGFFTEATVRGLSEGLSQRMEAGDLRGAFNAALHRFWWGMGDSRRALDSLLDAARAALGLLNADDIHAVYEVLLDLGERDAATLLLKQFLAANKRGIEGLALSERFGEKYDVAFKCAIEVEAARFKEPVDLEKTLDAIDFKRGWNPDDLTKIAEANFDEIVPLLISADGDKMFATRLITLLKFRDKGRTAKEKKVSEHTVTWLRSFAAADPISALRVRRFLPDNP